eukprot:6465363-Pyramimonas_sp.AAC.1
MVFKDQVAKWFQAGEEKKEYILEFAKAAREKWDDIAETADLGTACAYTYTQACGVVEAIQVLAGDSWIMFDFGPDVWETIEAIDRAAARNESDPGPFQMVGQAIGTNDWWKHQKNTWLKRIPKIRQYGKDMRQVYTSLKATEAEPTAEFARWLTGICDQTLHWEAAASFWEEFTFD